MVRKFINEFQNLEINKSNEHIRDNLSHLNFKSKIKFYGFYASAIVSGLLIYNSVNIYIQKDEFRKALITQQNVSPVATLFYSTYSSELEDVNQKLKELDKKQAKVPSQNGLNVKLKSVYEFSKTLKNRDEKILNSSFYIAYLERVYVKYLLTNYKEKINLNNKDYSYYQISQKLSKLDEATREKAIQEPLKVLMQRTNARSQQEIEALKKAITELVSEFAKNANFYEKLDVSIAKAKDETAKAIFSNDRYYYFRHGYQNEQYKVKRDKETLEKYAEYRKDILKQRKEARAEYKAKKEEYKAKRAELKAQKQQLNEAIQAIKQLQSEPQNYEINKEKVEKLLKKTGV